MEIMEFGMTQEMNRFCHGMKNRISVEKSKEPKDRLRGKGDQVRKPKYRLQRNMSQGTTLRHRRRIDISLRGKPENRLQKGRDQKLSPQGELVDLRDFRRII